MLARARRRSPARASRLPDPHPLLGPRNGMRHARCWVNWAAASALPLLLQACAGVPRDASLPINDPNEQLNRQMLTATRMTLRPAAEVVSAIPGPVHDRLCDFN